MRVALCIFQHEHTSMHIMNKWFALNASLTTCPLYVHGFHFIAAVNLASALYVIVSEQREAK